MDLLMPRVKKDKVFLFDSSLGEQVWEAEPITRFRFKKPVENEYRRELLNANCPTAGILFNEQFYIGTNDGMIYSSGKKIQRIPEILVDPELFLDEYKFKDEKEKKAYQRFINKGYGGVDFKNRALTDKIFAIKEKYEKVKGQETNLDRYLTGRLAIRGFAVNKNERINKTILYDGHICGITETESGKTITPISPRALYQVDKESAGFVPARHPAIRPSISIISEGIEEKINSTFFDNRTLFSLDDFRILVKDICPWDGSDYAPAKFATDGDSTAISHGDRPFYHLDILKKSSSGLAEKVKSVLLDPQNIPRKIIIREGEVFGDYGNFIRNFTEDQEIFNPAPGVITSISDSGLCTVFYDGKTKIYEPFMDKQLDTMLGEYVFLDKAPQ